MSTGELIGKDLIAWLLQQWCAGLALSLETLTGESAQVEMVSPSAPPTVPTGEPGYHGIRQRFSVSSAFGLWLGAPEPAWSAIGGAVARSAGIEDASPEDRRGSYLEVALQALSAVAQSLTRLTSREVTCSTVEENAAPPANPLLTCRIAIGSLAPAELLVCVEGISSLESVVQSVAAAQAPQQPAATGRSAVGEPETGGTIDLLYDVELPVSISFGRAHLALKEVLKLTSGSIVELNRAITEPVEVIVNNCVIARGEVVVVDGNYGIRILEIISRRERLRTLH